MRKRIIVPEFFEDSKISQLSRDYRLFYIGLWCIADDEGYFKKDSKWIKIKIFPYEDDISVDTVNIFLNKFLELKILEEQNGILRVKNFLKYQIISHPKKSELKEKFLAVSETCGNFPKSLENVEKLPKDVSQCNLNKENLKEVNANEGKFGKNPEPFLENFKKETETTTKENYNPPTPENFLQRLNLCKSFNIPETIAIYICNFAQTYKIEFVETHYRYFSNCKTIDEIKEILSNNYQKVLKNKK